MSDPHRDAFTPAAFLGSFRVDNGDTVTSVECICVGDDHFDKTHTVSFLRKTGGIKEVTCQVVVPRLGVDEDTLPIKRKLAHDLPYWVSDWKPVV
jgi:hypothetical protein